MKINKNSTIESSFKNKKRHNTYVDHIEDSEYVLVCECNNVGLKKLSKFWWTDSGAVLYLGFHSQFLGVHNIPVIIDLL
jgi:hypothetical protein